eukprot:jgi/Botrbrau1/2789/Bobra.0125s0002.1
MTILDYTSLHVPHEGTPQGAFATAHAVLTRMCMHLQQKGFEHRTANGRRVFSKRGDVLVLCEYCARMWFSRACGPLLAQRDFRGRKGRGPSRLWAFVFLTIHEHDCRTTPLGLTQG